jgi:hypothetical protein
MPQHVSKTAGITVTGILALAFVTLIGLPGQPTADNGQYRFSPHGDISNGVWRELSLPRGSCAQCHISHNVTESNSYGLFEPNSNQLCFAASAGGCHADMPSGGSAGYPAQESDRLPIGSSDPGYFEFNSGGLRIPGIQNRVRWPGRNVWEDPLHSPHYADQDMPILDFYGYGSCRNCHNPHGTDAPHDMLDTTYAGIVGSQTGALPENYALCLHCHNVNGPVNMDDTSLTIAYYYDRSINPGRRSGHGVSSGGGYVPSGSRLPCFDCHNPHGSQGNSGLGGNAYLLSDQRRGWYGLTDIKNDNDQVRRFCFGCHPPADKTLPTEPVEGLSLEALPQNVEAHNSSSLTHCYECHGGDYSTPTSHNVHNPAPGGQGGP